MMTIEELRERLYPIARSEVVVGSLTLEESLSIARDYIAQEHPGAICAFIFGSTVAGNFKSYSDLDLVVILPRAPVPEMRRTMFCGVPVECNIVDPAGFAAHAALAATTGVPNFTLMQPEPIVICDPIGEAQRFLDISESTRKKGPPPTLEQTRNMLRANIGTLILDLNNCEDPTERFAIAIALYPLILTAHLAINRLWLQPRKWAVRTAPQFASRVESGIKNALSGDIETLLNLVDETLAPWGGPAWLGGHPLSGPEYIRPTTRTR